MYEMLCFKVSVAVSDGRVKAEGITLNPVFPGEIGLKLALYLFVLNIAGIL